VFVVHSSMVREINASEECVIPEGVTCDVKARYITVKGKRGTLERSFKHLSVEIAKTKNKEGQDIVKVEKWFGSKKELAAVRTVISHINNMVTGVTHGYEYKMKMVYAHFPINVACDKGVGSKISDTIEIRNYLGEKVVRRLKMQEGCEVVRTSEKDEVMVTGNSIEAVGISVSQIQQCCQVKKKDVRKYLDGIYCTTRKVMGQ
jgi:large subunit ribosomal protein L9e